MFIYYGIIILVMFSVIKNLWTTHGLWLDLGRQYKYEE